MRRIFLILGIGFFFFYQAQAEVIPGTDEAIGEIFGNLAAFTQEERIFQQQPVNPVTPVVKDGEGCNGVKIFTISKDNSPLGWALLLDEMGKIKPITFLVAIDKEKKIKEVRVLVYRDMFGDQIRRKSFLRQFQGKSLKNSLQIGQDIDAVTSATISSQAAANAVKRSLKIIAEFKN